MSLSITAGRSTLGHAWLVCSVLCCAGCREAQQGKGRGDPVKAEGAEVATEEDDAIADAMMRAVSAFMQGHNPRAWLDHLPTRAEIVAQAAHHMAVGSGATIMAARKVVADGGASEWRILKKRLEASLLLCKDFLEREGVAVKSGIPVRVLVWGHPWKSVRAPKGPHGDTPELEIVSGNRHAFLLVRRARFGETWRLLRVSPLGTVESKGQDVSVKLCFTPPSYDSPKARPTSTHHRGMFAELDIPSRPGFLVQLKYKASGCIPTSGRLIHMHRQNIGSLDDSFLLFTNETLDSRRLITLPSDNEAFVHLQESLTVPDETLQSVAQQGTPGYRLRELRLRNNLKLRSVTLSTY